MARYGKDSRLPPRAVLRLARDFFGPQGELGLAIATQGLSEITFEGGGGSVAISALPRVGHPDITDVTILSREYDHWAERFLAVLTDAERGPGPLRRLLNWLKAKD